MTPRAKLLLALALCGLSLNLLLLYWTMSGGGQEIAGCGGAGACGAVMATRWSQAAGLPIAAAGAAIYALLGFALVGSHQRLAMACYAAIVGTALWLSVIQIFVIGHICPWCTAAHGIGVCLASLGVAWRNRNVNFSVSLSAASAAVIALALLQVFGPVPATHRIDDMAVKPASHPAGVHSEGAGRMLSFDDGRKIFSATSLPHLGSPDATYFLIEYFDYQCPACRQMSGYLTTLMERHPDKIGVILLPVPLDHACNPNLPADEPGHPGSCELARIAMAVWRSRPGAFPAFHRAMISGPPLDSTAAKELAMKALAPSDLQGALRDPWIGRLLAADIADWTAISTKTRQLPKLLVHERRVMHGLPAGKEEFLRVMKNELNL